MAQKSVSTSIQVRTSPESRTKYPTLRVMLFLSLQTYLWRHCNPLLVFCNKTGDKTFCEILKLKKWNVTTLIWQGSYFYFFAAMPWIKCPACKPEVCEFTIGHLIKEGSYHWSTNFFSNTNLCSTFSTEEEKLDLHLRI